MPLTIEQTTSILNLTQAMFSATPGAVYLDALGAQIESGQTITGIAQALATTSLFLGIRDYTKPPQGTDDVVSWFATTFADDLLGDRVSAANKTLAVDFVMSRFNQGASQDTVIAEAVTFLNSMPADDPDWGAAALHFNLGYAGRIVDNLLGDTVSTDNKALAIDLLLGQMASGQSFGETTVWAYTALDGIDHNDPVWGAAAARFDHRTEVSRYYTVDKGGRATVVDVLQQLLAGVTSDPASVATAKAAIDALSNTPAFDLTSLDGSNGFRVDIDIPLGDETFFIGANDAGDINGDGFDDLIIAVEGSTDQQPLIDKAFVLLGKADGFAPAVPLSTLDGSNGFRVDGTEPGSGMQISRAGDINRDGYADVLISTVFVDDSGETISNVYAVFGKGSAFASTFDVSSLDGSNGFRLTGPGQFAGSLSTAGDINGDGWDDIVIGAPFFNESFPFNGSSFVVFGKQDGFSATLDIATLDGNNGFRLDGLELNDTFGSGVSSADFNGDGLSDLLIGAPLSGESDATNPATGEFDHTGAVYVIFGKTGGFGAVFDVSTLDGSNGLRINGSGNEQAGFSVSGSGDVNGDGIADLVIGTIEETNAAYVVFGSNSGFGATLELADLDGSNGFRIEGLTGGALSSRVSSAGDVNGDGLADLIVGDGNAGASFLIYGQAGGFGASVALDTLSASQGLRFDGGANPSAAGDVNQDGYDDLIIIGADFTTAYVVFGSASL